MTLGFLLLVGGLAFLYAGLKGHSVADVIQGVTGADNPFPGQGGLGSVEGIPTPQDPAGIAKAVSGIAGAISPIPAGVKAVWKRSDQGVDVQLNPQQGLRAIDSGTITYGHDPSGFGPNYPILKTRHGQFYYGHTDAAVPEGTFVQKGQIVAFTSRTGHNAPPGWLEFGAFPPGSMQAGAKIRAWLRGLPRG